MSESPPSGLDPKITDYYERTPEEARLRYGPGPLEEARTRELIERHLPKPPAEILDIGGGAGVYAFWLAERGYQVQLVDASPRLIEEARRRNSSGTSRLVSCNVGDARNIQAEDESASAVLMLGPLYHLVDAEDRLTALREACRVLKPGGVLLAAGISRFASALDGLARELFMDKRFGGIVERDLRDGQHRNDTERSDFFTTAYFHRPGELREEVANAGFIVENVYGIEGPGWMLADLVERWKEPERRELVLRAARMLETEPFVIGSSAHLLAVGRRRNG
ncbi:MAG TPA: methyltransferase domain-containing protein [Gemmatimonadaceae bacterium]|nr:methyltransferase domain-containing protein [Gemmatimonadaceae bacterium]